MVFIVGHFVHRHLAIWINTYYDTCSVSASVDARGGAHGEGQSIDERAYYEPRTRDR